jgi:hypothetical protein
MWAFTLNKSEQAASNAWVRLPDTDSTLRFEALVQIGLNAGYEDLSTLTLELDPIRLPGLDAARTAMAGDAELSKPRKYIDKAAYRLARGETDKALKYLIKSASALAKLNTPMAAEIRHWVGNAIATVARGESRNPAGNVPENGPHGHK